MHISYDFSATFVPVPLLDHVIFWETFVFCLFDSAVAQQSPAPAMCNPSAAVPFGSYRLWM
jgi:hypothetical protein